MANTTQIVDVVLQLRRDNDYNYRRIENSFIPLKGEVCLVDTAKNGLRAKIGDGVTPFARLRYTDEDIARNVIIKGYLYDNQFYSDAKHITLIEASVNKIYLNAANGTLYVYNGKEYEAITQTIAAATAVTAGVMKLYDSLGENTDGTMTQKAITDELNDKVEIATDTENELLTFIINQI